jgi:hypothetical protein
VLAVLVLSVPVPVLLPPEAVLSSATIQ